MEGNKLKNSQSEIVPSFNEVINGDTTRFSCNFGTKEVGVISVTLAGEKIYDIGGLFVDPLYRDQDISSTLVKNVNAFLIRNHSVGKLVNIIHREAAKVYEDNGWVKGEFKSHNTYGAHEYTFDGNKQ